jgi:hypothetical protein
MLFRHDECTHRWCFSRHRADSAEHEITATIAELLPYDFSRVSHDFDTVWVRVWPRHHSVVHEPHLGGNAREHARDGSVARRLPRQGHPAVARQMYPYSRVSSQIESI